jgi:hypothetical protein
MPGRHRTTEDGAGNSNAGSNGGGGANGRRYWWVGVLLTAITFGLSAGGALLLRALDVGAQAATIKADIRTQTDCNNRQDGQIKELAAEDRCLAASDKMLSDTVVELRIDQRATAEQFKAVDARLSNIEKSQADMSRKLDRLLEKP